jgi:hypothetical protein
MPTIVGSIRDADGNNRAFIDTNTQETLVRLQPLVFEDDFVGAGHTAGIPATASPIAGYAWTKTIVGAAPPTAAMVSNAAGGVVAMALASTSEIEEASILGNNNLTFDASKNLVFEARAAFQVVPSVAGVEIVFGLMSTWASTPDTNAYYLRFQANGSGLINCQSKDGVSTFSVSSGVTTTAGAYHLFRIDATNTADVAFYIDGARVNAVSSISFAAVAPNSVLQLYAGAYKTASAGLGTLYIDAISVSADRV